MTTIRRGAMVAGAALALLAGAPRAESLQMTLDRPTLLNFLRAATPYDFEVTKAGFTETLTFYNPRELRFEGGRIRLKVDCRGEPIPVSAVLEPTLSLQFDNVRGAYVAKVEALPVSIGALGTVRLDQYVRPIQIPSSFTQTLDTGIPGLTIDAVVRDLKVLEDRIEARADLVFRKVPPARTSTARK